ncbi:hypothetical protein [Ileibacterium valens]|uniref:hypothetical protein n=1 Tax=Ileibacterium valens TaxID=1862668 RepID=UPI002573E40F|nr:hypothetical protein [Ileibacterium valens]
MIPLFPAAIRIWSDAGAGASSSRLSTKSTSPLGAGTPSVFTWTGIETSSDSLCA